MPVLTLSDIHIPALQRLFAHFRLQLVCVNDGQAIPGTYWGEPEAGIIGGTIYVRQDTPVHSALHEACHVIVAPVARRSEIHTNASDCCLEEDAACYLQIVLASYLPDVGSKRMMEDMDEWGYTFRLGSASLWFVEDAQETKLWLKQKEILPIQYNEV